MSDVVEAMARGMWEATEAETPWCQVQDFTRGVMLDAARAAIRAVEASGGVVVGKMPGDRVVATANSERWQAYYEGHNEALAAVRANAVKVEGV